jgi:acyl dehydratase
MFNFGDGAVAGLVTRGGGHEILGCHAITDGSFSLQVKVPAGGSVEPASVASVEGRRHFLDVADPAEMKGGLDEVSLPNFVAAARGALERSGASLADVDYLCGIHMKRSMHEEIVGELGSPRAAYLDDTGHMSGVDSLFALDRAARAGELADGDLVLLLAAGTGYTWAATAVRVAHGPSHNTMTVQQLIGQELLSPWREIAQERIDEFARATDDAQWIHVDSEAAASGPFGTTIAHGFLTLSLVVPMFAEALPPLDGYGMTLNYGLNRVRFTSPVPSGSRIRGRFRVEDVEPVAGGAQARVAATIELEGQEKPACVAEALFRFLSG